MSLGDLLTSSALEVAIKGLTDKISIYTCI